MIVFLNGQFVPEDQALVSVFDRGFLYGDGLFETLRVFNGLPFRWQQHMERLARGAQYLGLQLPVAPESLRSAAGELIEKNKSPDSLLRLTLSRGTGARGYSPRGAQRPTLVMSLHPVAATSPGNLSRWRLLTSSLRLPANESLAQFKTCNKLAQILARAEADVANADEALLLNTDGFVVEGSSSNLFWIEKSILHTPPLASGILAGVTRAVISEICPGLGVRLQESNVTPRGLLDAEGVFLSLSSVGVAEGVSLDGHSLSSSPVAQKFCEAYWALLVSESQ